MSVDNKFMIAPDAVVCKDVVLQGEITIGSGTVVHPTAQIRATKGPIVIGENNNIEETAVIENLNQDGAPMIIGCNNVFEIGSVVQAVRVGENNVFGIRSYVGTNSVVSNFCSIEINCRFTAKETLPDNTVIYGKNVRRIARDPPQLQTSQLEYLRKTLVNFHYLLKSS